MVRQVGSGAFCSVVVAPGLVFPFQNLTDHLPELHRTRKIVPERPSERTNFLVGP